MYMYANPARYNHAPTRTPAGGPLWRAYAGMWHYGSRQGGTSLFEHLGAQLLRRALPLNAKWKIAIKDYVA